MWITSLLTEVRTVDFSLVRAGGAYLCAVATGAGSRGGTRDVARALTVGAVNSVHLGVVRHSVAYAKARGASQRATTVAFFAEVERKTGTLCAHGALASATNVAVYFTVSSAPLTAVTTAASLGAFAGGRFVRGETGANYWNKHYKKQNHEKGKVVFLFHCMSFDRFAV